MRGGGLGLPARTQHKDFGAVAAAWGMLEDLGVAAIIDQVTGARRSDAGASTGTYLALAALGRLVAPCSKLAFADWWATTAAGRFTGISGPALDHRRFWDAMHAVGLEEISRRIALAIVDASGVDCSSVALDMTNFATFIDTGNQRAPIAQRGKAKQKRAGLRLAGLGLVVTRDGGIPLTWHAYPGDKPDVTQFPAMIDVLAARHAAICAARGQQPAQMTVVFDAGQILAGLNRRDGWPVLPVGGQAWPRPGTWRVTMKPHVIAGTVVSLALSGLIAVPAAVPAAAATATTTAAYTMTDLGSVGYGVSLGFAINGGGEVVGRSYLAQAQPATGCPPRHVCVTHPAVPFSSTAGTMTNLGTLGATLTKNTVCSYPDCFGEALAINRTGDIAGLSDGQAFLVHNGKMSSLGPGRATGINDAGQIVGSTSCCHAFVISGGVRTTLPDLSNYGCCPGGISGASGINNNGQIVGGSDNAQGYGHAVLWQNGTITDLGTLADPQIAPFAQSTATAINNLGQITGTAQTNSYASRGFLYSNGTMTDIGSISPEAINDHGVIVGYGALIYSGGIIQNLNNLIPAGSGFTLDDATAINNNGQIVANGYNAQGQEHAFLLTPG